MSIEQEVLEVNAKYGEPITMQSLCANCHKQGETRMMLTNIPFFKDVLVVSFHCDECGYKNNEIQNAGMLNEFGHKITLKVQNADDLNRDICKGEFATLRIPELDFEIPYNKKGQMSTLEGFLTGFKEDLEMFQQERRQNNPEIADQVQDFIKKLEKYISGDPDILPFTFTIEDPAGNSYIKNPFLPQPDPEMHVEKYERTIEQIRMMGYEPDNEQQNIASTDEQRSEAVRQKFSKLKETAEKTEEQKAKEAEARAKLEALRVNAKDIGPGAKYSQKDTENILNKVQEVQKKVKYSAHKTDFTKPIETDDLEDQAIELETECMLCRKMGWTRMCTCTIPYFKEIIVIAFTCDHCLHRETEVKTGGGISDKGMKYTINCTDPESLNRDLFKSESAEIEIPELGCVVVSGSLGGVFSTVEGVIEKMLESLSGDNPFVGDSSDASYKSNFGAFIQKLTECKEGQRPFTLILRDPLANCFIQNPNHPNPDPIVVCEEYERTFEENEDLGLNDINLN